MPSVPADVPLIYAPKFGSVRLAWPWRMLCLLIASGCLSALVTASRVAPNPSGIGTHQRLGLQQCQFLVRTGLPCPSCGMTTSFTHFVRGQFWTSFYVQPAGLALAIVTTMLFWACLYIAATGCPVHRLLGMIPTTMWMMALFGVGLFGWAWKIFFYLGH